MRNTFTTRAEREFNDPTRIVSPYGTRLRLTRVEVEFAYEVGHYPAEIPGRLVAHVIGRRVKKDGTDSNHAETSWMVFRKDPLPLREEEWRSVVGEMMDNVGAWLRKGICDQVEEALMREAGKVKLA